MHKRYSYLDLHKDITELSARNHLFCENVFNIETLGKTFLDKNIYMIKFGKGKKEILLTGAFHGMEDITAKILVKFAEEILKKYNENDKKILHISDKISVYFIPMVNPDGVSISMNEITPGHYIYNDIFFINRQNHDFTKWQANTRGVDINHNFDADWELSREYEIRHKIYGPSTTRYAGEFPESEPETQALTELVRSHNFSSVIAFHSQGEEIYYDFNGKIPKYTKELVERFERVSGYKAEIPSGMASFGGFKDWFIKEYDRPGFTIEVGLGENPLPPSQFESIYPKAKALIWEMLDFFSEQT